MLTQTNFMNKDLDSLVVLDRGKKGAIGSTDSQSTFERKGKVKLTVESRDGDELTVELKNALFVPNYAAKLITDGKLKEAGVTNFFRGDDFLETTGKTRYPIPAAGRIFVRKLIKRGGECINTEEMALASLKTGMKGLGTTTLKM